jgi:hypothetical protein
MEGDSSEFSMTFASRPQSRDERVVWYVSLVLCVVLGLAFTTLPFFASPRLTSGEMACMIVIGLLLSTLLPYGIYKEARRNPPRGKWRIDPDGIAYESELGKSQTMRWKEVESISWFRPESNLRLRCSRHKIVIPLRLLDESVRGEAIARLRAVLGSDFDLTRRVLQRSFADVEPRWLGDLLCWGRVVLLGVSIGCVMLLPLWLINHFHLWLNPWPMRLVLLSWIALLFGSLIGGLFYLKKCNPTWRKRIAKLPLSDHWEVW